MTIAAKVRTHKISSEAILCVSGSYNMVGPESPAIEAMTDFARVSAATIGAAASVVAANSTMISRGVRLLLVVDDGQRAIGMIHLTDLLRQGVV